VSAVFGREPSRPLPGDAVDERDEPIEAVVIDEQGRQVPGDEPDPVVDLRNDDEDALDVDELDTEPDPEPVAEEPGPDPEPVAEEPGPDPEPVAEEPEPDSEPVGEQPVAEQPVAEQPVAEQPVAEQPVAEQPVAEQPVAVQPVAEPDTEREWEPAVVPVPAPEPEPVAEAEPDDAWARRWDDLQATFVDDPRAAVDGAADLLSKALAEATPRDAGTEDLRVAFRRYRAAFRDLHPTA